jgi:hypothetical protein
VGFSFDDEQECMDLNSAREGPVKQRGDGRWSSHNNFALDKATVAAWPIPIDYMRLPLGYRA